MQHQGSHRLPHGHDQADLAMQADLVADVDARPFGNDPLGAVTQRTRATPMTAIIAARMIFGGDVETSLRLSAPVPSLRGVVLEP